MSTVVANGKTREASIEITIIRANGAVEHVGTVSYWHHNPLKRMAWRLRRWVCSR